MIVKSEEASAPSDITRTDWIVYQSGKEGEFKRKIEQAAKQMQDLVEYEDVLLKVALDARSMDCAIAFERANKGFLLSGEKRFIDAAGVILGRLGEHEEGAKN